MPRVTQRDIVESVSGIRMITSDLRKSIHTPATEVTTLKTEPLLRHIEYLERVADEMISMIPDVQVKVPK